MRLEVGNTARPKARRQVADFCSAPVADFYAAVDTYYLPGGDNMKQNKQRAAYLIRDKENSIPLAQQFSASGDNRRALEIIESLQKEFPTQKAQKWLRYHKAIFLLRSEGLEAARDLAMSVLDSSINNGRKANLRALLLTRMSEANDVDGLAKLLPAQILADKIKYRWHRAAVRIQKLHGLVPDSEPITLGETPPSQSVLSERRISHGITTKTQHYPPSIKMCLDGKYAPPVKLYILTNCTVIYWNGYSFFFDASGGFIRECSNSIPAGLNSKIQDLLKAPPPAITGVSAYICDQHSGGNYCHWILDWLPRLSLCERAGPFENIVCGNLKHDFMRESLDFLGYQDKTIIAGGDPSSCVWRFETLLVPGNGLVRNLCHPMQFCHPDLLRWWRSRLSARKPHRKLYIPRTNTRLVHNETDLLNLLDGFEILDPGRHSFTEQMKIFSEAEMVVGAHGAGLTNLLFAPEGCQVLELFPPYMGTATFFNLATALNHDYDLVMAEGSPPRPGDWISANSSFILPMKQVEQWLQGKV